MGSGIRVDSLRPVKPLGFHSMIALIPARGGSKRVPGKNTKLLHGKPLLVYSIEAAIASGLFRTILVSTDDPEAKRIAWQAGVGVHDRKPEHATDESPDIQWVRDVMEGREEEIFAILRPTSPLRTGSTIRRCYARFMASGADSIRAIEKAKQHPGKMWRVVTGFRMVPVLPGSNLYQDGRYAQAHATTTDVRRPLRWVPWHSSPTQSLEPIYQQNASLEMCWTDAMRSFGAIHGMTVCPFWTDATEGMDINTPEDWARVEAMIA